MKYTEFVDTRCRMCKSVGSMCEKCPLGELSLRFNSECAVACMIESEVAEEIVGKWATENHVISNMDKYKQVMKEVFGIEANVTINNCPPVGYTGCPYEDCNECHAWWTKTYKEPEVQNG